MKIKEKILIIVLSLLFLLFLFSKENINSKFEKIDELILKSEMLIKESIEQQKLFKELDTLVRLKKQIDLTEKISELSKKMAIIKKKILKEEKWEY